MTFLKIRSKVMIVCVSLIILTTLSVSLFAIWQSKKAVVTSVQSKAKSDLATTWELLNAEYPGEWHVEGEKLYKGKVLLNGNSSLVDEINMLTGDSSTVFLRDTRIATTVKKEDGTRAVGTKAAPEVVQTVLSDGKEYYGEALVVDKKLQTAYRPIKDSSDKIIGMWFVGVPKNFIDTLVLNTVLGISGVALVIVLVGLLVSFLFAKYLEVPILNIMKSVKEAEEGNLNVSINVKSTDEIGVLASSFANMMLKFSAFLREVQEATQQVKGTSGALKAVSNTSLNQFNLVSNSVKQLAATHEEATEAVKETCLVTEQLEKAIEQIAMGAQEQVKDICQTSELVTEVAKDIEEVTSKVADVNMSIDNTETVAQNGKLAVEKTIDGMNTIKETVFRSAGHIKKLGEHSQHIGEIVEIIDDIAEQTNLLALNAAIEAARAGEHGKGFAVVADEVRKLAERSGKATKEITSLITTIQKLTGQAVDDMGLGTKEVEAGSELADEAGKALNEILSTIVSVKQQVNFITKATQNVSASSTKIVTATQHVAEISDNNSAATEEMAASSSQVAKTVMTISNNLEQTTAVTRQVDASIDQMRSIAKDINVSSDTLEDTIVNLQKAVNVFKIN